MNNKKIFKFFNNQNNANKNIGKINEDRFEKTTQGLINQETKLFKNKKIIAYHRAQKHGDLDRAHIDFLLVLSDFTSIPIQIKSSTEGLKKHKNKHSYIFCLIIHQKYKDEDIENILISGLNYILKNRDK